MPLLTMCLSPGGTCSAAPFMPERAGGQLRSKPESAKDGNPMNSPAVTRVTSALGARTLAILAAIVVVVAGVIAIPTAALAAAGTVSSMTVAVQYDGTGPFPGPASLGQDAGPNNGIVRNGDLVGYTFTSQVSVPGDLTFQSTLPVGMVWDPSATINTIFTGPDNTKAGGTITNNGRTLTGIRTSPGGTESFNLSARVTGLGNGAVATPSFTYGGVSAAAPPVAVTAKPHTDITLREIMTFPSTDDGGVNGARQTFAGFLGTYKSTNPNGNGGDLRGFEPLASPITFTLDVPAGTTVLSTGAGVTASQPGGAGTPVTFTVTGMDTSASGTQNTENSNFFVQGAFSVFGQFRFVLFTPKDPFLPDGAVTNLDYRLRGFDPLSISGQSNFGTGYAAGQDPAVACPNPAASPYYFNSCARQVVDLSNAGAPTLTSATTRVAAPDGSIMYGATSTSADGSEVVLPGQQFKVFQQVQNASTSTVAAVGQYGCTVWDNALMNITGVPAISNATIQYTTQAFADDNARRGVTCGTPGDGSPLWYSDLASVPGGMAAVTGVRYVLTQDMAPGAAAPFWIPMTRPTTPAAIASTAPMSWFFQWGASNYPLVKSTYAYPMKYMLNGGYVSPSSAIVDGRITTDTASTTPGTITTARFTPWLIGSPVTGIDELAKDVTVTVDFSHSTVNPVTSSLDALVDAGQVQSYDLTSADPGPDGIYGTADDIGTAKVVFHLGDQMAYGGPADDGVNNLTGHKTVLPALVFQVQHSVLTPNPRTHVLTANIRSTTPQPVAAGRTSTANIQVAGVASFVTGKSASTMNAGKVSPGEVFSYTINWANATSQATGAGTFVDLLPFNGDNRGTTGLSAGPLQVVSASAVMDTAVQGAVTIQYTTDSATAVQAALLLPDNSDGATGVTWVTGAPPANATALRFITEKDLSQGYSGSATIQVKVPSLSKGGALRNNVYGSTAELNGDPATRKFITAAGAVNLVANSATVSGKVWRDLDFNSVIGAPDSAWSAGGASLEFVPVGNGIRYTAPVAADGTYSLEIGAGEYTVRLVSSAGWTKILPTSTLTIAVDESKTGYALLYQEDVPPAVLVDDTTTVTAGTAANVNVTANDTLAFPQDPASVYTKDGVSITTPPTYGTAVLAAPATPSTQSTVTYTADVVWPAVFAGQTTYTDHVTYTWTNAQGEKSTATLAVTVIKPMTGTDKSATVPVGGTTTLDAGVTGEGVTAGAVTATPAGATASVTNAGVLTFAAGTAAPGAYPITVTFTDAVGNTKTVTYTVTIQAAPTGSDRQLVVKVGGSDTANAEVTGTGVTAGPVSGVPAGATATVTNAGVLSFDAGTAAPGAYPLTVVFTDGLGQTVTVTYDVHVQAPPTATGGSATVPEGGTHSFAAAPMADPASPNASVVTGTIRTQPGGGASASANAAGTVTFAAGTAAPGTYTVVARFTDNLGQTVDATYTVTVQRKPTASGGTATIPRGGAHTFDAAPATSGTIAAATVSSAPVAGTVTASTDGTVVFDGSGAQPGTYPFDVTFTDDLGQTVTVRYTVVVQAPPTATGGSASIALNGSHTFQAAPKADAGVPGASIAGAAVSVPPSAGSATVDVSGAVVFDATGVAPGTYVFDVTFTDDLGQTVTVTYTVTVTSPPTAAGSTSAIIGLDDSADFTVSLTGPVTGSQLTKAPAAGVVTHSPTGAVSFDAAGIASGTYTFEVTFSDDFGQTTTVPFTVTVQAAPTATGGSAVIPEGGTQQFAASPHADPTVPSATITKAEITAPPGKGTANVTAAGVVTFDGSGVPSGTYTFDATFTDDLGQTVTTTYTVTVQAKPSATGGSAIIPTDGNHAFDADPKTDPAVAGSSIASATISVLPASGVTTAAPDGAVTYDGTGVAPGEYTFTATFTDDLGQTVSADYTVTVQAVPTAVGGTATIPLNGSTTFQADPTADPDVPSASIVSATVATAPSAGVATVDAATGEVVFDAAGAPAGDYTFTVEFRDDLGQTVLATYTVTVQDKTNVTGTTTAIIAVDDDARFTMGFDGTVATATVTTPPSAGSVTATTDGTVDYAGAGVAPGTYTFVVTFEDDLGQPTPVTYTVTVQAKPTATGGTATIGEGASHTFAASPRADPAVPSASIVSGTITAQPAQGTATADASGVVTFAAGSAAPGTYTFDATFADDLGQTVARQFTVTVQAKPTVPGAVDPLVVKLGGSGTRDAKVSGTGVTAGAPSGVPAGATATVSDTGVLSFDAGTAAAGSYQISVTFTDDAGQSITVQYPVTVQAAPTADGGTVTIAEGASHTFAAGPEADPSVPGARIEDAEVTTPPSAGSATATTAGDVAFDGAGAAPGEYPFEVTFTDDLGQTVTASYTVTVQAKPTATGGTAIVPLGGGHVFDTGAAADPRVAGSSISDAVISTPPAGGATATAQLDGTVAFDAGSAPAGTYVFEATFTDDLGQTVTVAFSVSVQADPVVTGETSAVIGEDQSATIVLDVATPGTVSDASVSSPPSAGAVTVDTDGTVVFDGDGVEPGTYTFDVTFTDDLGQSTTVTLTVTVQARLVVEAQEADVAAHGSHTFVEKVTTTGTYTREITKQPAQGTARLGAGVVYDAGTAAPGTYVIEVTYTDNVGQTTVVLYTVHVLAAPSGGGLAGTGGSVPVALIGGSLLVVLLGTLFLLLAARRRRREDDGTTR